MVGAGAALAVVLLVGQLARRQASGLERYRVPLSAIACPTPPGYTAAEFLADVQYLGRLPDELSLLDDDTPPKLLAAFAKHPWVARVEGVTLAPPRQVAVALTFRVPVLAVTGANGVRVGVDAEQRWLPRPPADLPTLDGVTLTPDVPAGSPWPEPRVRAAVRIVAYVGAEVAVRSITAEGVLTLADGRVVKWGRPPGEEWPGEPDAATKRRRLLGGR